MEWHRNRENDHWWPRSIQKYWLNEDGNINLTSPNGLSEKRSRSNKKIGASRGWHHVNFGDSPWTFSFERDFLNVDNNISETIDWILDNVSSKIEIGKSIPFWIKNNIPAREDITVFSRDFEVKLLEVVVSLLVRSPAFKNRMSQSPRTWDLPEDVNIGTINIRDSYSSARRILNRGSNFGFYLFLRSQKRNFLYGDGLLDALTGSLLNLRLSGYCLLPLTPEMALFFTTSINSAYTRKVKCIKASDEIVLAVNDITQIYSKDRVFSSNSIERISSNFALNEHLQLERHTNWLIDYFLMGTDFRD